MKSTIYEPREDSYLIKESLINHLKKQKNKDISILDMGTGSGVLAITCKDLGFNNITTVDVNIDVINHIKTNYKSFKIVNSDLFSSKLLENQKFDLIVFNPPYLPENSDEPDDSKTYTTAGKKGYEIIIRFLSQTTTHLNPNGKILLLFSTLSKPEIILNKAKKLGYKYNLLAEKKLFFEKLFVYEFE